MYSRLCLVLLCLALGAFAFPVKRDGIAAIEDHITSIDTKTKSLSSALTSFNQNSVGFLLQGFSIHDNAVSLEQAIQSATSDANAWAPLSETDGNTTLDLVETLVPNIQQALNDLISKKAAFEGLPFPGATSIAQQDLNALKQGTDALTTAFLAKIPASLMSVAQGQVALVNAAFNDAIAVYSS